MNSRGRKDTHMLGRKTKNAYCRAFGYKRRKPSTIVHMKKKKKKKEKKKVICFCQSERSSFKKNFLKFKEVKRKRRIKTDFQIKKNSK